MPVCNKMFKHRDTGTSTFIQSIDAMIASHMKMQSSALHALKMDNIMDIGIRKLTVGGETVIVAILMLLKKQPFVKIIVGKLRYQRSVFKKNITF